MATFPNAIGDAANPMLPLALFRVRAFTLANVLTLLLYAALGIVFFVVPLDLIQVQHYSPTDAGAALLPFALVMFALSRWSGSLVAQAGFRSPLVIGPAIAAIGFAPLTNTVMGSIEAERSGVAPGVNNAVARIAGLLAIAVFGTVLAQSFDPRASARLDRLRLSPAARTEIDRALPKMAGADMRTISPIAPDQRANVRTAIDGSFVAAFRVVMIGAALLALASAGVGGAIHLERRSTNGVG